MPLRELRVERVDLAERRGLPAPCGRPGGGRGCRVEDEEDGEEDAAKGSWVLRSAAPRVHPSARGSAEPRATGAVRRVQWPVLPMRAAVEVGALQEELALCERERQRFREREDALSAHARPLPLALAPELVPGLRKCTQYLVVERGIHCS